MRRREGGIKQTFNKSVGDVTPTYGSCIFFVLFVSFVVSRFALPNFPVRDCGQLVGESIGTFTSDFDFELQFVSVPFLAAFLGPISRGQYIGLWKNLI